MLLLDIVRNIIFLPLSYVMDYEVIDEDKEFKEEEKIEILQNYELQLAT
jgi:hypothetical protein